MIQRKPVSADEIIQQLLPHAGERQIRSVCNLKTSVTYEPLSAYMCVRWFYSHPCLLKPLFPSSVSSSRAPQLFSPSWETCSSSSRRSKGRPK